jgi:carbon monoxide dehydrogenase subunit G
MKLEQSFAIPFPRERVWAFLHDTEAVVRSLPGARADR